MADTEKQAEQGGIITVTPEELKKYIADASRDAAREAIKAFQAAQPPQDALRKQNGPMRNLDFQAQRTTSLGGRQTQEQVDMIALRTGGCSHGQGTIPCVPEYVHQKDMAEHSAVLDRIRGLGYVVELNGVEFSARYEPTEPKQVGDKIVYVVVDREEPEEAKPLIEALDTLDAKFSRVYLQRWLKGLSVTGDRAIDEMVADDVQAKRISYLEQSQGANLSMLSNAADEFGAPLIEVGSDKGAELIEKHVMA